MLHFSHFVSAANLHINGAVLVLCLCSMQTHAHTQGANISLLIDITKIGEWSLAKAVLVNMLRDARYKVDSCLMTLGR